MPVNPDPATEYTPDQWRAMLTAGAQWDGVTNIQAAVHLLTFTGACDHRLFYGWAVAFTPRETEAPIAKVSDWSALAKSPIASFGGGGQLRLLTIAASLANGEPVDLRENLSGLGSAHVRRVVEAVMIATGAASVDLLTVTASDPR